jgi:hypothetical protein
MRVFIGMPVVAGLLLSGCAELNSIYRARPIKPDSLAHVVTVDAKQRHLLLNPEMTAPVAGDAGSPVRWRMCAEAAPDVFSAYATSASAKGGVKERDVSAELGISSVETAATIERTQTINMLRESMYRTCERYLSGAIGRTTFITQAARDQRSMIAFLAIEQLTRTARPPATIISGPSTGASIKDGEAAAKLVEEFRKEALASAATLAKTRADLDAAAAKNDCKANDKPVVKDDASDEDKAKASADFSECMRLKTLEATQAAADKLAQERLDQALKLAAETVTSINAATQAGTVKDGAGGGGVDPQTAAVLSAAVVRIATNASIDESLMFCIGYLADLKEGRDNTIVDNCGKILLARSQNDEVLRAQLLSFQSDGTNFTITGFRPAAVDDNATPLLKSYLMAAGQPKDERQRRARLAGAEAVKLGLISDPGELANLYATGNAAAAARLLVALRAADIATAGRTALSGK